MVLLLQEQLYNDPTLCPCHKPCTTWRYNVRDTEYSPGLIKSMYGNENGGFHKYKHPIWIRLVSDKIKVEEELQSWTFLGWLLLLVDH